MPVKTATCGTHQVPGMEGDKRREGEKHIKARPGQASRDLIPAGAKVGAESKKRHIACDCVLSFSLYETLRHVLGAGSKRSRAPVLLLIGA